MRKSRLLEVSELDSNRLFIRWLGAFNYSNAGFETALKYEFNTLDERACEPIYNHRSYIRHPRVGLLINAKYVTKKFKGDVWSYRTYTGFLRPTQLPRNTHGEAFFRANGLEGIDAIVVRVNVSKEIMVTLWEYSELYHIPILLFKHKKLFELYKPYSLKEV